MKRELLVNLQIFFFARNYYILPFPNCTKEEYSNFYSAILGKEITIVGRDGGRGKGKPITNCSPILCQ